jgi:poly-gamma-glutamate capsule biosynthesis protein CapA/YwtB (metallophosphatase superfamily)
MNNRETKNKRKRLKKSVRRVILASLIMIIGLFFYSLTITEDRAVTNSVAEDQIDPEVKAEAKKPPDKPVVETAIKVSAAGDFTLGTDENFTYEGSFPDEASKNGLPYFVAKLDHIFEADDLSTVNLETTLTNATEKAEKTFRFKGDPAYAQILELGGIEAVNLANNHTNDYLEKGYADTIATLEKQKIGYFGYDHQYVTTIKGIKVGVLGYEGWEDTPEIRAMVDANIKKLREQGVKIILVHFHWGNEREYVPEESQKSLARYTIDSGADLILGHHPHVVQGIEEYNGKFIVYSLGNFMFGGNRNPDDKDTFVFQQTFHLRDGELSDQKEIKVVPFSISSVTSRNNYQPLLLKGSEAERIKQKIVDASNQISGSNWVKYETE